MELVRLGNTNITISRLGFGCCPMGGHGWGEVNEEEINQSIHKALELGINFFDTADVYGLGLSEKRLGQALKPYRDQVVIATKFGVRFDNHGNRFFDNSPAWLKIALENSLKRLDTDYIDLFQVHYWDNQTQFELIIQTLEKCKEEGKIRAFGVTNIDVSKIINSELLSTFSFEYSLLNREQEDLIKNTTKKNQKINFLSWGSLAQGLLSGKYCKESKFSDHDRRSRETYRNFYGEKLETNLEFISKLKKLQENFYPDKTISQIAIRWILDSIANSITLVGIKTTKQIEDISKALGWNLHPEHMRHFQKIELAN